MRDLFVVFAVFGVLPFVFKRPWIGILLWTWLSMMSPHRMAWGFSTTMPFAMIVALSTMGAMLWSKESKRLPWERETIVLALFICWMFITTLNAVYPTLAWEQFDKVIRIQLMIFVGMMLITTPFRIKCLVWVMALSIAFFGVKGGIFTIINGGIHRVQGPAGTFIAGNNEMGLALAMTVPLLHYLARDLKYRTLRPAVYSAMVLTAVAAIGTQSRGALLGMAAMGLIFWLKSKQKFMVAVLGITAVFLLAVIMPPEWYERMNTIKTYDEDGSAIGRLNAWGMAFNLANHRFFGGGFETWGSAMFALYAPDPLNVRDVHSVYFEVLGEHGYVGLLLFLLVASYAWRSCSAIKKFAARHAEAVWAGELANMIQVSMVAYFVAGTFLGMAYYDGYYNLILIVVAMKTVLRRQGLLGVSATLGNSVKGDPRPGVTPVKI